EARNPVYGKDNRSDDFRQRHAALVAWRERGTRGAREVHADANALTAIDRTAQAWRKRFAAQQHSIPAARSASLDIGNVLVHAYPDRIARQDVDNPRRYQLSNGRGARLHEDSALFGEPWLVVLDLRGEERDSLILVAAPFDADLLARDFPWRFA